MYELLKYYLINRTQTVKTNNSLSSLLVISHGIPQITVLGQVLFIIYINSLLNLNINAARI